MKTLRTLWQLGAELAATSPGKTAASLLLTLAMTCTEGLGLLLLMPLLTLVGIDEPNTMPKVTGWFNAGFAAVNIAPTLGSVLVLFLSIAGARALLQRWQVRLSAAVQQDFTSILRVRFYRAIAGSEWKFLVTRRPSELVHFLAGEIGQIGDGAAQLMDLAAVVAVSLVYVGLAFHLSPKVAVLVLICAGTFAWAVRGNLDEARASAALASKTRKSVYATVAEHVASMKVAKSYGASERQADIFAALSGELRDVSLEVTVGDTELHQTLEFGSTVLIALIVYVSLEVLGVPAAPMLVLLFTFSRLMPRLITIYRHVRKLVGVSPIFDMVSELERECLAAAEVTAINNGDVKLTHAIRFESVSFRYLRQTGEPAVADLTFEIAAGMTTAIVGPSGAGKSTLVDLLIGLLSPGSGRIVVDGDPLTGERLAAWRQHIGYVPQETFLFHDTVRRNLEWAHPGATDEELWRALRMSAADGFVSALPQGLDTVVGERGVLISGGEKQRLSLARALLRQPRMLVFDEATSSLDSENERRIQQAVEGLHQQTTIVIVTHRLSTIRQADAIHVLERGRIVESGSWSTLLASGSRFRDLCRAQGVSDLIGEGLEDVDPGIAGARPIGTPLDIGQAFALNVAATGRSRSNG